MTRTTRPTNVPVRKHPRADVPGSHRRPHRVAHAVCTIVAVFWAGSITGADEVFLDNFHDGDVMNNVPVTSEGLPVHWTTGANRPGTRDASSGDYVLAAVPESENFVASDVLDLTLGDTSIRGQVRSTAVGGSVGFAVRNQDPVDRRNYHGLIIYRPDLGGTILYLGRRDGETYAPLGHVSLPFDIRNEDAMLQLDAVGNDLKLWGWRAGDPMPKNPQVVVRDSTYASGFVRISAGSGQDNDNIATFRFVHVADTHIHDPEVLGDYNHNGMLDAGDLDLQASVIIDDTSLPPGYDVDGNRDVDYDDRVYWLHHVKKTWVGDANLDAEFNSSDMVQVFAAGKYETDQEAGWAEGDWDGSGFFDSSDMVAAFADGGYEQGRRTAVVAVPEPTSAILLLCGLIVIATHRRRVDP